jgi:hypothetical protein
MKAKKFKAYVGEPDFHDGTITRVQQGPNDVSVEIKGYSGARYLVRFTGVQSVISHNPEGMVLYALSETEAEPAVREFHFANWREPHEEGGDSILEVTAQDFSVNKVQLH